MAHARTTDLIFSEVAARAFQTILDEEKLRIDREPNLNQDSVIFA